MEGLLIAFHRGWTKRGLVSTQQPRWRTRDTMRGFKSRNKKKFIVSASRAEAMGKLFQAYLHVATFLDLSKQRRVFTEVVWPGQLLVALNVGHLHTHPGWVGQGLIRHAAPVESRAQLKVVGLTSGVNMSFCAGGKEPLLADPALDAETLSGANSNLDPMTPRMT